MLPLVLSNNKLRDSKERNLCFVNSALQVLYCIDDVREIFQSVDPSAFPESWPISKELCRLFQSAGTYEISAGELRSIVGSVSNKPYPANGGQQDMEEFLIIFLAELRREVDDDEGLFSSIIEHFWGQEVTVRKFVDTPNGRCVGCQLYPSYKEEKFLTLKIQVPELNQNIFISHLVASYYSESTDQLVLRCGNCCTHTSKCPQTGNCKPKNATNQQILSKSPEYLLVQLMRFGIFGNIKNQTCVIPNKVLELPNLDKYELVTVTNHIGPTASSGHYVTCTNLLGLTWVLCDDNSFSAISEYEIISPDNYVYLYKKVASKENKSTGHLLAQNSKMETTDYAMKNNKLDNSIYRETCQKEKEDKITGHLLEPYSKTENKLDNSIYRETCQRKQSVPTKENTERIPQNKKHKLMIL